MMRREDAQIKGWVIKKITGWEIRESNTAFTLDPAMVARILWSLKSTGELTAKVTMPRLHWIPIGTEPCNTAEERSLSVRSSRP